MKKNPGRKQRRLDARQSIDKHGNPRNKHYRGRMHTTEHIDQGSRMKMMGLSKPKKTQDEQMNR